MKITRKGALGIAAAALAVISGGAAFAATASPDAPTPIGTAVTATEAYTDSISDVTAVFGTLATPITAADTQVPVGSQIQFGATDSRGFAIHWSTNPAGFIGSTTGLSSPLPAIGAVPVTIKVEANDTTLGNAKALATVTLSQGTTAGNDSVTITPDTVVLGAPVNANGQVSFPEPSGVTEHIINVPAGMTFAGGVLSSGTAVPGRYPLVIISAADAQGATATEYFNAVVKNVFAAVPVLSRGAATYVAPTRENVVFDTSVTTWVHFQIAGPGGINGHEGWVHAVAGQLNAGVYSGLLANHTYAVFFTPVADRGAIDPTGKTGHVTFISNRP